MLLDKEFLEVVAENGELRARIAELQQEVCSLIRRDPDDDKDARIAELEDGLSSACEYAQKVESALKRLHDAALDIDVNEMSSTERDWWQTELRAARAALGGDDD